MEAESSSSGHRRQKRPRQKRSSDVISYESSVANLSREGKETLMIVSRRRQLNKIPNTSSTVFDNTCPRYNWLRSGWIAEERLKVYDRLYRYFYDPLGQMYHTRGEVDQIYADIEKSRAIVVFRK
ncbi:hypothetical protein AtNW77_Chr5g0097331 [Arabidopsis thaliana]|uniref:Uncharacterized protein n=4 Tax=Arabidopsis TaxID=3701 RepID=Q5XV41_ARATH|nr:uncharacterized protein AT5G13825 [Arabidopsis thaliana]KAG7602160.1 hypothetical protein ISN45_At05g012590 [Arabidopsis thaliana x Arabidopsis arenosa]KAG7609110.1 hypothetical protein ISN44_As05g012550 [Arabidopsis suecica]AAU44551.1 hypothetical protein AT5G13825 [Arabidopsis thaliana]AAV63925.1 hypothetical protein [Arabidopsis thaliana]AED91946.1 hypothetical protein AT5G13825 [Arabidopsis thaliana]|eukprot:NP_680167.1 hypothetical protein AT5G13825 [Arabidopsis thaliana]